MSQTFSDVVDWTPVEANTREQVIESDWFQGPGAFGGVIAGAVVRAVEDVVDSENHDVRSLNLEFLAPVDERPARMKTDVVRRGSSVVNVEARIEQRGEVAATATATLCRRRESSIEVDCAEAPEVPAPDELEPAPDNPLFPSFAQHYEHRFAVGSVPFTGSDKAAVGGWGRLKEADEPADAAHIAALLDIWPPAVLSTVSEPMGAATISWQIVFDRPLPVTDAGPEDFYLVAAETQRASAGYAEEEARLFDRRGRRLARALQLVTVFG